MCCRKYAIILASPQAGPSLKETFESYEAIFKDFKESFENSTEPALREDFEQLKYAALTFRFLYNRVLYKLDNGNEEAFRELEYSKEELLKISSPLRGYDFGDRYKNGFTALAMHEVTKSEKK